MNKITEVAVAISGNQFPSKYSFHKARLAIEAMRDPTEGMIKAVTDQPACLECGYDVYNSKPERPWHVMIDAALEEGE